MEEQLKPDTAQSTKSEFIERLEATTLEVWLGHSTCLVPPEAECSIASRGLTLTVHIPAGTLVRFNITPEKYGEITFTNPVNRP